jgi:tRNA pseudouridine55 synthase
MDGLLIIDKPAGPTSHDVVSRMRRLLREKRIGHCGTLDPAATGVLLLVVGRATRLSQFLSASDKSYEAVVRLGFATDTADADGQPVGPVSRAALPPQDVIDAALEEFRGTFLQQPPAYSAKKVDGIRSYKLARAARVSSADPPSLGSNRCTSFGAASPRDPGNSHPTHPRDPRDPRAEPAPASVTVHRLEIMSVEADQVTLRVDCSAGFYVRSLAHDLGQRLGVGGHLAALRRTRSGDFSLDQAVTMETVERDPQHAVDALIPLAEMLPAFAAVTLTAEGVLRAVHGRELGPADTERGLAGRASHFVRLLDQSGQLIGIAEPVGATPLLHPSVVLV